MLKRVRIDIPVPVPDYSGNLPSEFSGKWPISGLVRNGNSDSGKFRNFPVFGAMSLDVLMLGTLREPKDLEKKT